MFYHIVLNDVVYIFLILSNDINRLLCSVVVAASCLLLLDKKSETLNDVDVLLYMT